MRSLAVPVVGVLLLVGALEARAEMRCVLITVAHKDGQKAAFSIQSDVKSERKKDVGLDEASAVIEKMQGWGSSVCVFVVSEKRLRPDVLKKLVNQIADNAWLDLVYLRSGMKPGFIEHRLISWGVAGQADGEGVPAKVSPKAPAPVE